MDEYLRVKGHDDIYAIGDINDVPEEKMAYTAKLHSDALISTFKGKPKKYKAGGELCSFECLKYLIVLKINISQLVIKSIYLTALQAVSCLKAFIRNMILFNNCSKQLTLILFE